MDSSQKEKGEGGREKKKKKKNMWEILKKGVKPDENQLYGARSKKTTAFFY